MAKLQDLPRPRKSNIPAPAPVLHADADTAPATHFITDATPLTPAGGGKVTTGKGTKVKVSRTVGPANAARHKLTIVVPLPMLLLIQEVCVLEGDTKVSQWFTLAAKVKLAADRKRLGLGS